MKKNKAKSTAQKRRARAKAKARQEDTARENWVEDRLAWLDVVNRRDHDFNHGTGGEVVINDHSFSEEDTIDKAKALKRKVSGDLEGEMQDSESKQLLHDFSIICWNVLADAYCSRSSHKNLPSKFQTRVFNRNQRQHQIRQILRHFHDKLSPDLIALQEVDPPLEIAKCMRSLGYGVVETAGSSDGRIDRVDSCGLYFREKKWECLDYETIRLDDLAILRSSSENESGERNNAHIATSNDPKTTSSRKGRKINARGNTNNGSLKGFERSFVRKNVTLMARMEHKHSRRQIVIVVSHLFWNPAYDYVKLCQAHYVAIRANSFCKMHNDIPIVWCGDFNSQPKGYVHQYLTKGVVNAKASAPWYTLANTGREEQKVKAEMNFNNVGHNDISGQFDRLSITKEVEIESKDSFSPKVKYLLDYTLNRFCRWLRILGLDAALETEEEEKERTRDGKITIFQRCKDERRCLITTASKLLNRKDCPPGTYLLDTKSLLNLESAIVHLLLSHGVKLEPKKMLTRCVVCNGSIEPVHDDDRRRDIFQCHQAPDEISLEVLDVYQCNNCSQGYWWCEKPTSSASRVKSQASRLLELCVRGGVPIEDDLGMFDYIDVEKIMTTRDKLQEDNDHEKQLDVVQWLKVEDLRNPLSEMASAYALKGTQDESLPFTNVTYDFVGSLDYILYQTPAMTVTDLLFVPKTFEELNNLNVANGHLLPSYDWPSDHLAIGCRMQFRPVHQVFKKVDDRSFKNSKANPIPFPVSPKAVHLRRSIDKSKSALLEPQLTEAYIKSHNTIGSNESQAKSLQNVFPPGPPSAVSWCSFIDESESDSVSKPKLTEASTNACDTVVAEESPSQASPTSFPPAPPLADPWCGFISESESDSVSEPTLAEASTTSHNTVVSEERETTSSLPHGERCACGCIPKVPSLFEMAELRRQYRLSQKNGSS